MNPKQILEQENKCIQEEPVYCSAVCPVHVNVRAMINYIQKGDFTQALQIYRSKALFPGLISRICTAPCEHVCIRKQVDDVVSIRMLESSCAEYGVTAARKYSAVRKKQHVAIVGGGLTGLSCALEIVRKGYVATVYEQSRRLGGRLWEVDVETLPREVINAEMAQMEKEGVNVVLGMRVDNLSVLECDAIFIATGRYGDTFGLNSNDGDIAYDEISLASQTDGIFVGGGLLLKDDHYSAIHHVASGSRAARSIERYLKKASLTSGRESEGVQSTRLYTCIEKATAIKRLLPKTGFFSREEAICEAKRCLLCECMECVKACTFLEFFHQNPRQYIRDITKTVTAQQGLRSKMVATRFINSCSLCGLCKEICPTELDMGQICQEARYLQVQADSMPPAFHEFWLREMEFSSGEDARLFKNQPGFDQSAYLFFPGCRMGSSNPDYVMNAYGYLKLVLKGGVGIAISCCGAPAEWSGHQELIVRQSQQFAKQWQTMGKPEVIIACPSCQKMFYKYLPSVPVKSLWHILVQKELPSTMKNGGSRPIALYDPCASRYIPEVQQSVRKLLEKMNYNVEELRFNGRFAQCCSYGGLISTINPELAEKIKEERTSANSNYYVTYCTNCRDNFADSQKPTWYLLDILFGGDEQSAKRCSPTISQRRQNRKNLKKNLLEVFWSETMDNQPEAYETIKLKISYELNKKLDKEYILIDEIKQVIHYAQKTENKLIDNTTKHFVAYLQIGIITYWVEFLPEGDEYTVFNAYSHRMQIVQERSRS
jgi:glutamate synthase (NADPH/NADH) small chain